MDILSVSVCLWFLQIFACAQHFFVLFVRFLKWDGKIMEDKVVCCLKTHPWTLPHLPRHSHSFYSLYPGCIPFLTVSRLVCLQKERKKQSCIGQSVQGMYWLYMMPLIPVCLIGFWANILWVGALWPAVGFAAYKAVLIWMWVKGNLGTFRRVSVDGGL